MSRFVTLHDFTNGGPYALPANEFTHGADDYLQDFIDVEEVNALRMFAGNKFAAMAIAALGEDPVEDKWVKVFNGAEYEVCGRLYKWGGIKGMLIPYLYSLRLIQQFDAHMSAGIQEANVENATKASIVPRIARASSAAFKAYGYGGQRENSLLGFIQANGETYPDFVYNCKLYPFNRFGL